MVVRQQTLKTKISCRGIALNCGRNIRLTLLPADENTGILFRRTDLVNGARDIPAHWKNVANTRLATTLSNGHGATISVIEHLMAALSGCGIDNAIVEVDGDEIPIMDGSAEPFVFLIECAGIVAQAAPRSAIKVLKTVSVVDDSRSLTISPSTGFGIDFTIDFDDAVIGHQQFVFDAAEDSFRTQVSRARTFCREEDIGALHAAGMALGGSLDNAVVVGKKKVLNKEGLRYTDEFVRHKILDCIGDLYLAGKPIIGTVEARLSGHELNNLLSRKLLSDKDAWDAG